MIKTPLRYPGGKSKAIKFLAPYIPEFKEFREPFVGGGSMFIYLAQKFPNTNMWINDFNSSVSLFWYNLKSSPDLLACLVQAAKDSGISGKDLYNIKKNEISYGLDKAVRFFILNRITFSGCAESGGYSQNVFEKRFTQSYIDRLKALPPLLKNVKVTSEDYQLLLEEKGEDVFIFLDPPYLSATKSKLYGKNGDLHTSFDHNRLANSLKECKHKWMMTYDDCEEIRDLYSFANIIPWKLQYVMNNVNKKECKKGGELLISNYLT